MANNLQDLIEKNKQSSPIKNDALLRVLNDKKKRI